MKFAIAIVATALMLCVAGPAAAADGARERAIKRCELNHGTDCRTAEGLKPWIDEETPMTAAQRRSAAAANLRRQNETRAAAQRQAAGASK